VNSNHILTLLTWYIQIKCLQYQFFPTRLCNKCTQ